MEQHIVIGKIVAPHGVRGEFRIMPQTDHPERYAKMKKITLDNGREYTVVSLRQHKNVYLMKVEGIDSMNDAETPGPDHRPASGRTASPAGGPVLRPGHHRIAAVTPEGETVGT